MTPQKSSEKNYPNKKGETKVKYILGTAFILWTYSSHRIDPLSKGLLYALIAVAVYLV